MGCGVRGCDPEDSLCVQCWRTVGTRTTDRWGGGRVDVADYPPVCSVLKDCRYQDYRQVGCGVRGCDPADYLCVQCWRTVGTRTTDRWGVGWEGVIQQTTYLCVQCWRTVGTRATDRWGGGRVDVADYPPVCSVLKDCRYQDYRQVGGGVRGCDPADDLPGCSVLKDCRWGGGGGGRGRQVRRGRVDVVDYPPVCSVLKDCRFQDCRGWVRQTPQGSRSQLDTGHQ